MAGKTVDDLKELRASLVQLRRKETYLLSDDPSTGIEKLVQVHLAIEAMDAVIEGEGEAPELDPKAVIPAAAVKREEEEDWGR
jgi:hypothetical protein